MIKGDPQIGEVLHLSYNRNVTSLYAGDQKILFHDVEYDSDEGIMIALKEKCHVDDPEAINLDNIAWLTEL